MEPLIEPSSEIVSRLQHKFGASITDAPRGFQIQFPDVTERFELSTANAELTLFADSWHEHFSDLHALERFLGALFAGTAEIVVTYRVKTPIGHKVLVHQDDGTRIVSSTGILGPLFWRRKSWRTFNYKSPNQAMRRTAGCPYA